MTLWIQVAGLLISLLTLLTSLGVLGIVFAAGRKVQELSDLKEEFVELKREHQANHHHSLGMAAHAD